jgi:hypothetical protein
LLARRWAASLDCTVSKFLHTRAAASSPKLRRPRPGVALAGALWCLVGCTTTHVLHLGDPQTPRRMNEMVLSPGTIAALVPLPHAPPPALKYDVVGPATGGLLVSDGSGQPMFARYDDIRRLETIDRSRGARDGALAVGVPAFFLGVGLTFLLVRSSDNTPGSGSPSTGDTSGAALAAGAILLAVGAGVGALYGAAAGHHDVYVVEP